MMEILFISIIPATLIVLGGIIILQKGPEHTSSWRILFYLLFIGVLLMIVVFVIELISLEHNTWLINQISALTTPIVIGVLALILVNIKRLAGLEVRERIFGIFVGLILLALLIGSVWMRPLGMVQVILSGTLALAFVWVLASKYDAVVITLSLLVLIMLALFNADYLDRLSYLPGLLRNAIGFLFFSLPGLVVALAAVWITSGLKLFPQPANTHKASRDSSFRLSIILRFGLAAVLLGYLAYTVVWASIWDQTSDGLGGVMFATWSSLVAIAAGMVMGVTATKWYRSAGFVFAMLVPALMFAAFSYGWSVSYHAITEERASRIQGALESYYEENGRYPKELSELVPNYLFRISAPVIIRGENWCYQGGQNYYRLGAFYREYFSTPLSLQTYASAGNLPDTDWECNHRLATMKALYDPPPFYEMETIRPTTEPLPTSLVPIQRTPLHPLLNGQFITLGSWSHDGRFLLFSQLQTTDDGTETMLSFLNVETGEICQSEMSYPPESDFREKHVWLPDGRLVYISEDGEMDLLKPCVTSTERLTDHYPERFTEVAAYDPEGSRILLLSQDSYWILDSTSLDGWPIPDVGPNPYEFHWDHFAWSPDGERLAISRLNGREREAGSNLYLIDGDSGQLIGSQLLDYATDQSAPGVEWLTYDELLLHTDGILAVVDYRSQSPKITNVIKDIFDLDIAYPHDIASMSSIVDPAGESYFLAVRINQPGNQDVYLYHSESGNVERYHPSTDPIFFFPGGEWAELPGIQFDPPEQDEFELVWVDTPGKEPQRIVVQGHTPRNYPVLFPSYLPQSSQITFHSSQGISLVSIPDGEMLMFWELSNGEGYLDINLQVSPNEDALIAIVDGVALYHIPLQRE